jgi:hypothetical protein
MHLFRYFFVLHLIFRHERSVATHTARNDRQLQGDDDDDESGKGGMISGLMNHGCMSGGSKLKTTMKRLWMERAA